jgi:hypothetical protein
VLDAACGIGYGTAELAAAAQVAIGIDSDPRALVSRGRLSIFSTE